MCHMKYIRRLEGQVKMCHAKTWGTGYYESCEVHQTLFHQRYIRLEGQGIIFCVIKGTSHLRNRVLCVMWSTSDLKDRVLYFVSSKVHQTLRNRLKCVIEGRLDLRDRVLCVVWGTSKLRDGVLYVI